MPLATPPRTVAPRGDVAARQFPLCLERAGDAVLQEALQRVCAALIPALSGTAVRAALLTGSTARGEGTVLMASQRPVVCSDFDIVLVVATNADARALRPLCLALSQSLSRLLQLGPCAHVDIGGLPLTVLRRPPPAIFFIELQRHAKLLWGDPAVLSEMPALDPATVPVSDVLTLVHNRTIEHLRTVLADPTSPGQALQLYGQCKAYVDAITVRLMLQGRYESQYQRRLVAYDELHLQEPAEAVTQRHAWFDLKLAGTIEPFEQRWGGEFGSPAFAAGLQAEQERVVEHLYELWRSAGAALLGRELSDPGHLADAILQAQWGVTAWLRGWYRFGRARVGFPRLGSIAAGTPELLTYLTAVMISRALPAWRRGDAAELAPWLERALRYYPLVQTIPEASPARWRALHRDLERLHSRLIMNGKLD